MSDEDKTFSGSLGFENLMTSRVHAVIVLKIANLSHFMGTAGARLRSPSPTIAPEEEQTGCKNLPGITLTYYARLTAT